MHVINIIVPIFTIILLGWGAQKTGYLEKNTSESLLNFIFKVALPALIFSILAQADLGHVENLKWLGIFSLCAAICFIAGFLFSRSRGHNTKDALALGITSSLPNDGMISIPLLLGIFGNRASGPIGMAMLVISTGFIGALITLHLLNFRHTSKSNRSMFVEIIQSPLVIAMAAGIFFAILGFDTPDILSNLLTPLANTVMGGALFAIGMELDFKDLLTRARHVGINIFLKLMVMPALALMLGMALQMKPFWLVTLVITAATPSIKSIYIISKEYGCNLNLVSNSIVTGTSIAIFSLSLWLFILAEIWPDVF